MKEAGERAVDLTKRCGSPWAKSNTNSITQLAWLLTARLSNLESELPKINALTVRQAI